MKNVLLGLLCVFMLSFTINNSDYKKASFLIEGNSKLVIIGSTNINSFNCDLVFSDIHSQVKALYQKSENKIKFQDAHLELSNSCFDCGSKLMNKDFLEMLDTEKHPNITLDLKEITLNPKNPNEVIALLNISLAGCSKLYSVWLNINELDHINAIGCLKLKLSDFNLEPPKKVLGLVVVDDAIEIALDLKIKALK
jgi:polyisoprenoid-binding protein YceI